MSNTTTDTKTNCSDCDRLLNTEEAAAPNRCRECRDIICDICVFGCQDMRHPGVDVWVCSDCFVPYHDMHPDHHLWVKAEPHQEAWLKAWEDGEADTFQPTIDKTGLALVKARLEEWWEANGSNSDIQEDDTGDGKTLTVDNTLVISKEQRVMYATDKTARNIDEVMVNGYLLQVIVPIPATRLDPPEEDIKELGFYRSEAEIFRAVVMEMFEDHVDGFIVQWQTEEEEKSQAEWEKMCDEWDESLDAEKTTEPQSSKEE